MDSLLPHTPTRVSPEQWLTMLQRLAADADRLHGDPDASAEQVVALALRWFAVIWPAITPRVVAASCRATIANGTPSLPALPAAVQLLDTEERMAGWIQRGERWQAPIRPELVELEPPRPHVDERTTAAPPAPPPPARKAPAPPAPRPLPAPSPEPPAAPAPEQQPEGAESWLTTSEVCELLNVATSTLRQVADRLLPAGQWVRGSGRRPTRFSDEAVELLQQYFERSQGRQGTAAGAYLTVEAELDRLIEQVRQEG